MTGSELRQMKKKLEKDRNSGAVLLAFGAAFILWGLYAQHILAWPFVIGIMMALIGLWTRIMIFLTAKGWQ